MQAENKKYWLKSGSHSLLNNIQGLLFGFGGFYFLVRLLNKHDFGIWSLFVATTTIFEMARNGLVQNALIKFLAQSPEEEKPDVISASFFLSGLITLACMIINICLAGYLSRIWHDPVLVAMFYTYTVVYFLNGCLSQFQFVEQANLGFAGTLLSTSLRQGGFFLFVLGAFILKRPVSLISLVYVQGLSTMAGALVQYGYIRKQLVFSRSIHRAWIRKLFNFGKYAFGSSISGILTGTINQMMLGAMLSADAAGVFNVANKIMNLAEIPTNAMGIIVFPQSSKRFEKYGADASKYLYEKSVGTILALLLPCLLFLYLFPGFTVRFIAGKNYLDTIPIIKLTVIICLFPPFSRLFGTIVDSMGRPKLSFYMILLFTLIELALNYFLIPVYGIMGAVYATLIANVLFFIAIQILLVKEISVNFLNAFVYAGRFYGEFYRAYVKPVLKK
jgi:lipopolysaccharide exporter